MSAGMLPRRQQLRWKSQTTARDAVERVKRGGSVKNDTHVRKLIKTTAEARYCCQGILKDLSPGAVVTLALSFTAAEWVAVNRDPKLLQETLDYFKTRDFQIDRWWTYWRNLQLEQPDLAKLFLLEIIYEYWKDNVTELIHGVKHISNGLPVGHLIEWEADEPVPKRRKANHNCAPPVKSAPQKGSNISNPAPRSDDEPLSAITGRRPESAELLHAENWNAVGAQSQFPINDPARGSLRNTSLNTTNSHGVDNQQISGVVPDTSRLVRTSTISAILNHNSPQPAKNGPVSNFAGQRGLDKEAACDSQVNPYLNSVPIPQQSDVVQTSAVTNLLRAIRFEKCTLQQIVLERPDDILGGIWFGSPAGFQPFVSLRLSRSLDAIVKQSGHEVYAPGPPADASSTVKGVAHLIKIGVFRQMVQRDGFGDIFWNECGEEAFVRMDVVDTRLAADFIRGAVPN